MKVMFMTRKYVIQNRFPFLRESDFGRIPVSSDTDQPVLKCVCPKRNLKEENLLLMKSKRTRGFPELGLKLSMLSVV